MEHDRAKDIIRSLADGRDPAIRLRAAAPTGHARFRSRTPATQAGQQSCLPGSSFSEDWSGQTPYTNLSHRS